MIDYTDYKLEDFLTDESFRAWVKGTADAGTSAYWQQVVADFPGQQQRMNQAAGMIRSLSQPAAFTLDTSRQTSWEAIEVRTRIKIPVKRLISRKHMAAAVILLLMAAGIWHLLHHRSATIQQSTIAAQRQRVVLPDESVVILGANSSLSWKRDWPSSQVREVWLEGEASFEVKHLNRNPAQVTAPQRFLVHINKQVTVEVLGTVFLVRNRRGKTTVSLESGSVKVDVAGNKARQMVLTPGQTVEVNPVDTMFNLLPHKETIATVWRAGSLQLNNTPVLEIVQALEDNYGKRVVITSPELLEKRVDGIMPLNNEKQALMALSSILGADIHEEENGTIVLRKTR